MDRTMLLHIYCMVTYNRGMDVARVTHLQAYAIALESSRKYVCQGEVSPDGTP